MGTRFLASSEMAISAAWKRMILEADATDSLKADFLDAILPPYNRPHYQAAGRVLRTAFYEQWSGREDDLTKRAAEIGPQVMRAILAGGGEEYVPFAGQSVGLVREILPAAEIVRRVIAEAERVLAGLSTGGSHAPPRKLPSRGASDVLRDASVRPRPARARLQQDAAGGPQYLKNEDGR